MADGSRDEVEVLPVAWASRTGFTLRPCRCSAPAPPSAQFVLLALGRLTTSYSSPWRHSSSQGLPHRDALRGRLLHASVGDQCTRSCCAYDTIEDSSLLPWLRRRLTVSGTLDSARRKEYAPGSLECGRSASLCPRTCRSCCLPSRSCTSMGASPAPLPPYRTDL